MKQLLWMLMVLLLSSNAMTQEIETIIRSRPNRMVIDSSHVLSKTEQQKLEKKLVGFDKKNSTQLAIVLVNSIGDRKLEETATELFNSWGIGQQGKNNGLLILAAIHDRKIRIEVGRGLEEAISNETAAKIISTDIKPAFKEARYYDGLNAAVNSLMRLASKAFPDTSIAKESGIVPATAISQQNADGEEAVTSYRYEGSNPVQITSEKEQGVSGGMIFLVAGVSLLIVIVSAFTRSTRKKAGIFSSGGYRPVPSRGGSFLGGLFAGWFFSDLYSNHQQRKAGFLNNNETYYPNYNSGITSDSSGGSWDTGSSSSDFGGFDGGSSSGGGASGDW